MLVGAIIAQLIGLAALRSDLLLAAVCLALALGLLVPKTRHLTAWLAAAPFLLLGLMKTLSDPTLSGHLALVSSGARYLTPVALALWLRDGELGKTARTLLRVGIAFTFIGHGIKALSSDPHYLELIRETGAQLLDWRPGGAHTAHALQVIGVLDIVAGLLTLTVGLRAALIYMALWGAITAVSRVSYDGWHRFPEVLFRATHFVAPWVLLRARPDES